jgi:hypothetical protein
MHRRMGSAVAWPDRFDAIGSRRNVLDHAAAELAAQ